MDTQDKRAEKTQADEPAKGGTKPADTKVHPSGDDPKRQGDPFKHEQK